MNGEMLDGLLTPDKKAPGALEVFDAVSLEQADMYHPDASYFLG